MLPLPLALDLESRNVRSMVYEMGSEEMSRLAIVQQGLSNLNFQSDHSSEELNLLKERLSSIRSVADRQHASLRRTLAVSEKALLAEVLDEIQYHLADHQMSMVETLEMLASSGDSIARFGDGELRAIFNPWFRFSFQSNSASLQHDLRSVLDRRSDGLRVALPLAGRDRFWAGLYPSVWAQLKMRLNPGYKYANAQISRPIAFEHLGAYAVDLWREVWRGKSVAIVTGKHSRFDVLPELFDSAKRIGRIDSMDTGAYADVERLCSGETLEDYEIFVISLGPAGTVLADRIHQAGRRALDVGHLSSSYLRVFQDGAHPESLPVTKGN